MLLNAQARLKEIQAERDRLRDEIKPLLLGRRIRYFGHLYEIVQVTCWYFQINGYGVRVNEKTGRVGTRGFNITIDPRKLEPENAP